MPGLVRFTCGIIAIIVGLLCIGLPETYGR